MSQGRATGGVPSSRILVIGCGFIGTHIVEELVRSQRPPVVLTRSRPQPEVASLIAEGDLHIANVENREALDQALVGVGHVVFSAGGLLPAASEQDPELDARLTLGPVRAVLEALREQSGVGLTYLSSGGTVYGEPAEIPVGEDAPTNSLGSYGRLHLACEAAVLEERERGLPVRVLRCATVYGEHQTPERGQGAVVTFLHRIATGTAIDIFGAGETIRDYVYAGDVAAVVTELADRDDGPAVLNVGSGEGTRLIDLVELAAREAGRSAKLNRLPARDFEVQRIVLDIHRLRETIGFEPTPLEAGIARTHCWLTTGSSERV